MSHGKTIIVPQGVINPNTVTVIEIPAESQHESVFVAHNVTGPGASNVTGPIASNVTGPIASNVTGPTASNVTGPIASNVTGPMSPREPSMAQCEYLFHSNVEPPYRFRPRYESSPQENRPQRDPTPETIDSSHFRNQNMSTLSSSLGGTMDYNNVFKPENDSSVHFTNSDMSDDILDNMGVKLTSKTSITHSGSNIPGGQPTTNMVTTSKLINFSHEPKPYNYYGSPQWLDLHKSIVDDPYTYEDMYNNAAESSPVVPRKPLLDSIRDSAGADSGGSLRTSVFQKVMGGEMQRQIIMPMESPIAGTGGRYTAAGMPIGMSPPRSYYRQGRVDEHDRGAIMTTLSTDQNSGMTTGNVTRVGTPEQGTGTGSYQNGELCAGSVCAGGTYCKSADLLAVPSPTASPRTPQNVVFPTMGGTPQSYARSPREGASRGIDYMQAVPPSALANKNTFDESYQEEFGAQNRSFPGAHAHHNAARATATRAFDASYPGAHHSPHKSFGETQSSYPAGTATFDQSYQLGNATFDRPCPGANATFDQICPGANATFDQAYAGPNVTMNQGSPVRRPQYAPAPGTIAQHRTPPNRRHIPMDNSQQFMIDIAPYPEDDKYTTPQPRNRDATMAQPPGTMETMLLMAENRERELLDGDLRRLQLMRRRLYQSPAPDRALLSRNLFGEDYKEVPDRPRRRQQVQPRPVKPKPAWKY